MTPQKHTFPLYLSYKERGKALIIKVTITFLSTNHEFQSIKPLLCWAQEEELELRVLQLSFLPIVLVINLINKKIEKAIIKKSKVCLYKITVIQRYSCYFFSINHSQASAPTSNL